MALPSDICGECNAEREMHGEFCAEDRVRSFVANNAPQDDRIELGKRSRKHGELE